MIKAFINKSFLKDERSIYVGFGIFIAITLVFWPLLNSIICFLFFIYWLLFSKKEFSLKTNKSQTLLLFLSLYIVALIGSLYSVNIKEAMLEVKQKIPLALFPIILGTTRGVTRKDTEKILISFSLATIIGSFICLLNGLIYYLNTGSKIKLSGYDLIILKQTTPSIFCVFVVFSVSYIANKIADHYIRDLTNKYIRWFWVGFFFNFGFMLLLGNRMTLFCFALIVIYYLFCYFKTFRQRVFVILIFVFANVFIVKINPRLQKQWQEIIDIYRKNEIKLDEDKSLGREWGGASIRIAIWRCSWDIVKKYWITGVGNGDVQDFLQKSYEDRKFFFASRYNRYNSHNQFLQQLLSTGLLSVFLFCLCLLVPLKNSLFIRRNIVYTFFILTFAIVCITESLLEINKGIVWYSFFNSIFAFQTTNNSFK